MDTRTHGYTDTWTDSNKCNIVTFLTQIDCLAEINNLLTYLIGENNNNNNNNNKRELI